MRVPMTMPTMPGLFESPSCMPTVWVRYSILVRVRTPKHAPVITLMNKPKISVTASVISNKEMDPLFAFKNDNTFCFISLIYLLFNIIQCPFFCLILHLEVVVVVDVHLPDVCVVPAQPDVRPARRLGICRSGSDPELAACHTHP